MSGDEQEIQERLERQRKMGELAQHPDFLTRVDALVAPHDLEVFEEEWMALTIINRGKELVLSMHLGETSELEAQAEMKAFYERKREFFLDEDGLGEDEEEIDDLLGLDEAE